jgi:ligand-binding SRPBCC domain-containing protein
MSRIELEMEVSAPVTRVFDLARSIDAHVASIPGTDERPVAGKMKGLIELGETVTWQARHFGLMQELTSRITRFDRPHHFRDSMVTGPFRRFDHDHFFDGDGARTHTRDVFDFDAPFGPLGKLTDFFFLERYMRNLLHTRLLVLKELAEGKDWKAYLPADS